MGKCCKDCKHWKKGETVIWGECTRFPEWMSTKYYHYCGEFEWKGEYDD